MTIRAWFNNIQKVFFLTSRNGQVYSKLSLDFGINDDPKCTMWFQFKLVLIHLPTKMGGKRNCISNMY